MENVVIKLDIDEKNFVESLLNMRYSNVSEKYILLCMGFYALSKSWDFNKMIYYIRLLNLKEARK